MSGAAGAKDGWGAAAATAGGGCGCGIAAGGGTATRAACGSAPAAAGSAELAACWGSVAGGSGSRPSINGCSSGGSRRERSRRAAAESWGTRRSTSSWHWRYSCGAGGQEVGSEELLTGPKHSSAEVVAWSSLAVVLACVLCLETARERFRVRRQMEGATVRWKQPQARTLHMRRSLWVSTSTSWSTRRSSPIQTASHSASCT